MSSTLDELDYSEDDPPIVLLPDEFDFVDHAVDITKAVDEDPPIEVTAIAETDSEGDLAALQRARDEEAARIERERALRAQELRRLRDVEEGIDDEIARELAEEAAAARRRTTLVRVGRATTVVVVALLGLLLAIGGSYYSMAQTTRPFHHLHALLRSSGAIGLTLGVTATVTMTASLTYLVRKRLVGRFGASTLPGWLSFHVTTGFLGPAMALFHAAFVPTSLLGGLALGSMVVVVASGVLGRYLLIYLPKAADGEDVKVEDLMRRVRVYRRKLVEHGVDSTFLWDERFKLAASPRNPWLITAMVRVLIGDRESRRELRRLEKQIQDRDDVAAEAGTVLILVRRLCRERQSLVRHRDIRRLVTAWRFLHRWLAIVMGAAIVFHIAVALEFGNLFGGGH